jgi:transcriptional regulator with XRE-family HTH domain
MAKQKLDPIKREQQERQAARLRRTRLALGITQTEAAKKAGVSVYKWNRMELGVHPIDTCALENFAATFETATDYVLVSNKEVLKSDIRKRIEDMETKEVVQAARGELARPSADIRHRLQQVHQDQPVAPPHPQTTPRSKRKATSLVEACAA